MTGSGAHVGSPGFWLRWTARDLRSRWVVVFAIALVLGIGTGVYAGLGSTATWRREANDRSFSVLGLHDLRVAVGSGATVPAGRLAALVDALPDASVVTAADERLVVDGQIETAGPDGPALVVCRIVGMPLDGTASSPLAESEGIEIAGGPVDAVWIRDGSAPRATSGSGLPEALLEAKFADDRNLPSSGTVDVGGGRSVRYTGLGIGPEEFYVAGPEGTILAGGDAATLYLPVDAAGELVGRPGQVNELVLTLADPTAVDAVRRDLEEAATAAGLAATVTTRADVDAYRVLYEDIDSDQQFWNALSALVLGSAALAAFNLVTRTVEAQRREIGVGMALGVPRRHLAIRPMATGLQIAVLGTVLGVAVGTMIGWAMGDLLRTLLPLPVQHTPFQLPVFARAAALAMVIPVAAAALPVWRAVRVEPVRAIRTGHLTAAPNRLTGWTGGLRLPGSSVALMPLRNVLRTPRRTVLTAIGVGASITALVATLGMLDSFRHAIEMGVAEVERAGDDRVVVQLSTFAPADGDLMDRITGSPAVGEVDAGVRVPATVSSEGSTTSFDLLVQLIDVDAAAWTPTVDDAVAVPAGSTGIVIARKAATDLGVTPGDRITLRHLRLDANGAASLDESTFVVSGLHRNPIRTFAYADIDAAAGMGLSGLVNVLDVYPAPGSTALDVQRALFGMPGVASSQSVARIGEIFDEALEQFLGFLVIAAGAVLVLAVLISFNATRITIEERRREHATMRAFGVPLRSIIGVVVKESVVVGLLATAFGVVAGTVFLRWMLGSLASRTLPELGIDVYVAPQTIAIAAVVGVVAVAVAPLLLARRLARMDVPATLRVVE